LPKSGTMQNGLVYRHPVLARLIEENGYSSWPTPTSGNASNANSRRGTETLYGAVANWMTPNTMDALPPKSQKALDKESSTVRKGRKAPNNLRDQVNVQQGQAEWPTPTTQEYPHPDMKINAKGRREPKKGKTDHSLNLQDKSAIWMTPTSRDWKDGDGTANVETNSLLGRQAPRLMINNLLGNPDLLSHPDQTTPSGTTSSNTDQTSHQQWRTPVGSEGEGGTMDYARMKREKKAAHMKLGDQVGSRKLLNPKFVEWLMGWPEDWVRFNVLGYSGSSETE